MTRAPVVSILSGKGGVGKTAVALNLANALTTYRDVWLIDLDVFNRGATAALWGPDDTVPLTVVELFTPRSKSIDSVDIDSIEHHLSEHSARLKIGDRLWFLPAARASEARAGFRTEPGGQSARCIEALCQAVGTASPGAAIVFDTHGGLEDLSLEAALIADVTYIVNEPDLIALTGMLTLYREISELYQSRHADDDGHAPGRTPWIEFILNRIPSRMSRRSLRRNFESVLCSLSSSGEPVALYLPSESEMASVLSDEPFIIELFPWLLFSRKVKSLARRTEARIAVRSHHETESNTRDRRLRLSLRPPLFETGRGILVLYLLLLAMSLPVGWLAEAAEGGVLSTVALVAFGFAGLTLWLAIGRLAWRRLRSLWLWHVEIGRRRARRSRLQRTVLPTGRGSWRQMVAGLVGGSVVVAALAYGWLATRRATAVALTEAAVTKAAELVEAERARTGTYPSALGPLSAEGRDGWGRPLRYCNWMDGNDQRFEVSSAGPNGVFEVDCRQPALIGRFADDVVARDGGFIRKGSSLSIPGPIDR